MKRIIFFTILVIATLSIVHSVSAIYTLWQKRNLVAESRSELQKTQEKNKKLQQDLATVSTQSFIEEEARNKLFLLKPQEATVFIDKNLLSSKQATLISKTTIPTWLQWWNLFFS